MWLRDRVFRGSGFEFRALELIFGLFRVLLEPFCFFLGGRGDFGFQGFVGTLKL